MRKSLTALGIAGALLLVGGVAVASIPDSSGVIHGCRKNSDGSVRVIDSDLGQTCASGWTALNWSQTGPQGPAGATGPQGPAGVSGYEVLTSIGTVSDGDTGRDSALFKLCPAGKRAVGGGGGALNAGIGNSVSRPDVVLQSSNPYDFDANGTWRAWRVQMRRIGDTTEGYAITMWVVCAAVS